MQLQDTKYTSAKAKTIWFLSLLHKLQSIWWPFAIRDTILTTKHSLASPVIPLTTVLETKWALVNPVTLSC